MKVLVTGNLGYVGSILTNILLEKKYDVIGFDSGFFKNCNIVKINKNNKLIQHFGDIRKISKKIIKSVDIIVHLAALSNDPLGELEKKLTSDINFKATMRLARLGRNEKVKRFIYMSSQSMYGISDNNSFLKENDKKKPITEYAITKYQCELELKKMKSKNFTVVFLRPSTVYGFSPRLRADIVLNNFIVSAITDKTITINSNGQPWRPTIHIEDLCNIIISSITIPSKLINGHSFNLGSKKSNFKVIEFAKMVKKKLPNTKIKILDKNKDDRTYKVSFDKFNKVYNDYFKFKWTIDDGIKDMILKLRKHNFIFKGNSIIKTIRLKKIQQLIKLKKINSNLYNEI